MIAVQLKSNYNTIWVFMIASVGLYAALAWNFKIRVSPGGGAGILLGVVAVAAAAAFAAALLMFRTAIREERLKVFGRANIAARYISQRAFSCMTLLEAVSIGGLALRLMGYPLSVAVPFFFAGAAGLILHRLQAEKAWRFIQSHLPE